MLKQKKNLKNITFFTKSFWIFTFSFCIAHGEIPSLANATQFLQPSHNQHPNEQQHETENIHEQAQNTAHDTLQNLPEQPTSNPSQNLTPSPVHPAEETGDPHPLTSSPEHSLENSHENAAPSKDNLNAPPHHPEKHEGSDPSKQKSHQEQLIIPESFQKINNSQYPMDTVKDEKGKEYAVVDTQKILSQQKQSDEEEDIPMNDNVYAIQQLSNAAVHALTDFKSVIDKMYKEAKHIKENTEEEKFQSIQKAWDIENELLKSHEAIFFHLGTVQKQFEKANKQTAKIFSEIDADQKLPSKQKDYAEKLKSKLHASHEDAQKYKALMDDVFSSLKSASDQSKIAPDHMGTYLNAPKFATRIHDAVKKAYDAVHTALKNAPKPHYDMTRKDSINDSILDCTGRDQEDCKNRSHYCVWTGEVAGCQFHCGSIHKEDLCQSSGYGMRCKWGEEKPNASGKESGISSGQKMCISQ